MQHIEFSWQSSDGLRLYGQSWQPDDKNQAVLCLVHGQGEHCGRYAHVAAALSDAGYTLLASDLRGHGKSGGLRGHTPSYEALLDDIDHLLDEAAARYPGRPRFLYGHSMGGNLVLNHALRRRPVIAGVIATSPWLRLAFAPPATTMLLGRIMDRLAPSFLQSNGLNHRDLSRDPAIVRAYETDPLVHDRISAREGMTVIAAGEWAMAHAADFPLPLLLMHASADRILSAPASQEFAAKVRENCTFRLWDELYHEIHNEPEKAEVLEFMIGWLRTHTPQ